MQTFYIGNSLLGDELAIAQQLISDILTCFAADVLDRAHLVTQYAPRGAPLGHPTALLHIQEIAKIEHHCRLWRKRGPILASKLMCGNVDI